MTSSLLGIYMSLLLVATSNKNFEETVRETIPFLISTAAVSLLLCVYFMARRFHVLSSVPIEEAITLFSASLDLNKNYSERTRDIHHLQ